jgi:hypothetical protein
MLYSFIKTGLKKDRRDTKSCGPLGFDYHLLVIFIELKTRSELLYRVIINDWPIAVTPTA